MRSGSEQVMSDVSSLKPRVPISGVCTWRLQQDVPGDAFVTHGDVQEQKLYLGRGKIQALVAKEVWIWGG